MTAIDVNDFLASSGSSAPALKFDTLGDTYEGVILDSEVRDVTSVVSPDPCGRKDSCLPRSGKRSMAKSC